MVLYNNISMQQARRDWLYLKEKYGHPYDFCGGFCNCDHFENLLLGKETPKEVLISLIKYYFYAGLESPFGNYTGKIPDINDARVKKIIDRYSIDYLG